MAPSRPPFRLGPWRVEPSLHRLVPAAGAGEPVQVEPKVLGVLVHLASRPGEVVSQEELLDAVWETRYVSEELVRRAVYELRKVLGDDARHPEYIETVARAGYRLIAPVLPAGEEPPRAAAEAPGSRRAGRSRRRLAAAAAALAVAAVAAGWWIARDSGGAGALRLTPLTATPGLEYDPALSPDGARVAFVRAREDGSGARLVVRLVAEDSEIELARPGPRGGEPAWSPDGSRVAFVRREERAGGPGWLVVSVPALGGSERRLADLGPRRPYGLAWSPDGRTLAFGWGEDDDAPYALHLLSLDGGSLRRLTAPPPAISGDGAPAFSPDGREIAFLRNRVPSVQDVFVVDAAGGEARRVTPAARKITDVSWAPDGASLLVAVYEAGDHRLARLPLEGGAPRRLAGAGEGAMSLTVAGGAAPGAGRLVYSRYAWRFTLWRLDRDGGGRPATTAAAGPAAAGPSSGPEPRPLPALSSTRFDSELALSPDGTRVAFSSSRSGSFEIWIAPLGEEGAGEGAAGGGGRGRRLTEFGGPWTGQPRWSPDGRTIAFASAAGGDVDLWTVDPRGGLPRRLTDSPALDLAPAWAADGRSLYFASNRGGAWEIWRREVGGSGGGDGDGEDVAPERVTRGGGYFARPSADGRSLWFTRRGEDGLWRMALPHGEPEPVVPALDRSFWGSWVLTPEGVVFVAKTPDHRAALLRWTEGAGTRELARLRGWPINPSLAAGPDGRWLLWSQTEPGQVESDLMLLEGL